MNSIIKLSEKIESKIDELIKDEITQPGKLFLIRMKVVLLKEALKECEHLRLTGISNKQEFNV